MAVLGGVLDELIDTHVVDTGDVAQITGATSRSVSRWATAKAMPRREAEDRLLELKAVVDQLRLVLRDEQARLWMRSPNPDLDWRKPLELIAEGEYRRVIAAVLAMAEGVTA
jgi:putative toxin-antitoxin system antitoxin component (TIGR02293 family)